MKLTDLDWGDWFYALMKVTIGGGASSVSGWLGTIAAQKMGVNVPDMNLNTLWIYWLSGSLTALFFYLKQSPLPKQVTQQTTTTLTMTQETTAAEPPKTHEPERP